MREELKVRGLTYEKKWEINLLSCELKLSLQNDWIKANPNTDKKVYNDDDENTKSGSILSLGPIDSSTMRSWEDANLCVVKRECRIEL